MLRQTSFTLHYRLGAIRPRPLFLSIRINCLSGSKFFHGLIVAVITSDHIA